MGLMKDIIDKYDAEVNTSASYSSLKDADSTLNKIIVMDNEVSIREFIQYTRSNVVYAYEKLINIFSIRIELEELVNKKQWGVGFNIDSTSQSIYPRCGLKDSMNSMSYTCGRKKRIMADGPQIFEFYRMMCKDYEIISGKIQKCFYKDMIEDGNMQSKSIECCDKIVIKHLQERYQMSNLTIDELYKIYDLLNMKRELVFKADIPDISQLKKEKSIAATSCAILYLISVLIIVICTMQYIY